MGLGARNPDREIFSNFGPSHLTSIDWTNSYHRTSVASSLVKGVYTMETDRKKKRVGREARAKPWWDFFHFTLLEELFDPNDKSIYGAVYEYELYNLYQNTPHLRVAPRYVIAFRGTSLRLKTIYCDVKLDLRCFFNCLHRGARFVHAIEAITNMVGKHQESAIWLAGHSLGAGLALLAGKTMIKSGYFLESYIFNPPISSIPLDQLLQSQRLKSVLRIAESVLKSTLTLLLKDLQLEEDDPRLASWTPYLYVNSQDIICSEYIGYFKHKTIMSKIGVSKIESRGARSSIRSLLVQRRRTSSPSDLSTEPLHLLLSADMTINRNNPSESKTVHGLHQWWEQDPALRANWESCCIRPCTESKMVKLLN
ncbi:hypothetical protein EUTSA_v10005574mg [Eutrema salsugineum]|uniref:Fungal lipase-type domain-containing protein n=1 Tax=Eutrema salsugineum TaxID=72664 RepID=V4KPS5_EUTSA|nr:GDSL esterase/lipase At4g10955 [Eutrema salsugineum]ESQ31962.1 hypothetical protein EUTSA_v10005574mg [Eutrema salsugineum]